MRHFPGSARLGHHIHPLAPTHPRLPRGVRAGLRSFGLNQVCPTCRVELLLGPEKLPVKRYFDGGSRGDLVGGAEVKVKDEEIGYGKL